MSISAQLVGVDRLLDAFRIAPDAVQEVQDVAVLDAGEIVAEEARLTHRYQTRTGAVEHSVDVRLVGPAAASVFLDTSKAPYAPFVHAGTRPHTIMPVKRELLRWVSRGDWVSKRMVRHPGTKADPFLFDAAAKKEAEVVARLQEGVWDGIKEAGLA